MKLIQVDEVVEAVHRILMGVSARPKAAFDPEFFSDQDSRPLGRVVRGAL